MRKKVGRPSLGKKSKHEMITFRLNPIDLKRVQLAAQLQDIPLSTFCRKCVLLCCDQILIKSHHKKDY